MLGVSCKPRQHTAPSMPDIGSLGNEVGHAIIIPAILHGLTTASGEKYDSTRYTGAHKSLPFGTKVLVTHTLNGKTVTVKIIDRGLVGSGQVIALSKAAAMKLDTNKIISMPVRVRYQE
ncbi:MAG: septal ring lytic transglycosylase RlpA family protein [Chitinophagaceae bacterium]|nr:septal ring lytic transglycosylase RlpA family protein [Chitinophagaceae bacterium]